MLWGVILGNNTQVMMDVPEPAPREFLLAYQETLPEVTADPLSLSPTAPTCTHTFQVDVGWGKHGNFLCFFLGETSEILAVKVWLISCYL